MELFAGYHNIGQALLSISQTPIKAWALAGRLVHFTNYSIATPTTQLLTWSASVTAAPTVCSTAHRIITFTCINTLEQTVSKYHAGWFGTHFRLNYKDCVPLEHPTSTSTTEMTWQSYTTTWAAESPVCFTANHLPAISLFPTHVQHIKNNEVICQNE